MFDLFGTLHRTNLVPKMFARVRGIISKRCALARNSLDSIQNLHWTWYRYEKKRKRNEKKGKKGTLRHRNCAKITVRDYLSGAIHVRKRTRGKSARRRCIIGRGKFKRPFSARRATFRGPLVCRIRASACKTRPNQREKHRRKEDRGARTTN